VTGPDGHLWTGSQTTAIEIIPTTLTPTFDNHAGVLAGAAKGIASGGDGNIWLIDSNGDDSAIVRVNPAGTVVGTPTKTETGLQQIAAGPPGQMGFTQPVHTPQRVGRIDYAGTAQYTNMPGGLGDPTGIVFGNDGAYWTADFGDQTLGRLTPAGPFTEPIQFDPGSGPRYLAKGAGDTLWVGLEDAKKIARITGVSAPPIVTPPPPPTGKVFAGLSLSVKTFRVSGNSVSIPIACPSGLSSNCVGSISLRTASPVVAAKKKRKTRLKLGSAKFSIASGKSARVKVTLSKKALKLIAKRHSLKVRATMTATAGGVKKATSSTVTLKAPKKNGRR
jgi:hypothetical protein